MYIDHGKYLYMCYLDFQKAFDSMWRNGLWRIMQFMDNEENIVRILEAVYQDTMSAVRVDGGLSDWFATVIRSSESCKDVYCHHCYSLSS